MGEQISRREFLDSSSRTVAGVAAGLAVGGLATAARGQPRPAAVSPNEKVVVGLIGCGGMGNYNLDDFMRAEEVAVAAVCDVDASHLKSTADKVEKKYGKRPKEHKDFRRLIDMKDIDVVIIGTPDHWHAIPMIYACMAGKDVYVEKPVSHNIAEGRAMVNAARKYRRIVQVGMQQRSGEHFQKAVELVRSGVLGDISYTRTWNLSNEAPDGKGNPPDSDPPPGVDYDFWLGPAPKRRFNPNRFHHNFRWFFDYAAGMVGDWNVHVQDVVHWAMGVDAPVSVSAVGGKYVLRDNRDTPDTLDITYDFVTPAGKRFIQTYSLSFGCATPFNGHGYGTQFFGSNGSLFVDRGGWEIIPDTKEAPDPNDPKKKTQVPRTEKLSGGGSDQHWPHVQNFLACVKSRKVEDLAVDIEVGHKTAAACHLGNIAWKVGKRIYWDAKREIITDKDGRPDREANKLLTREYRAPYTLPKA